MKKYLRIYWMLIKINFASIFAYRANFYNSILITVGWGTVSIVSVLLLTSKTSSVYGWSRQELYLLTGLYSIMIGIFHMLFSSSLERFARVISLGGLDSYLLSPVDTQLYMSTKNFRPTSFLRIVIGVGFTLFILHAFHIVFTFISLFVFILLIVVGVLLLYSFWFFVITLTIWNPNLTNLVDFLYNFSNLGRYPPALLLYSKNIILFVLIPITLIASVPAHFVLGKVTIIEMLGLVGFSFTFFIASRLFWQFALKHYSSASS